MNQALRLTLSSIYAIPKHPPRWSPEYEHWLANKVWEAAISHCAKMSGPKCAESILAAAGVACCEQNEQGGIA